MKYLLVYPTHANFQEEFERYEAAGIDVAAYPARTTVDTKLQLTKLPVDANHSHSLKEVLYARCR